jgi:hypothetical protein
MINAPVFLIIAMVCAFLSIPSAFLGMIEQKKYNGTFLHPYICLAGTFLMFFSILYICRYIGKPLSSNQEVHKLDIISIYSALVAILFITLGNFAAYFRLYQVLTQNKMSLS